MRIDSGFPTIQVQIKEKDKKSINFSIEARNITMNELSEELIKAGKDLWRRKNGEI